MRTIDADVLIQAIDPMYKAKKDIVADTFAEGCMQFEKLIKQQPTIPQWIPVSERLPNSKKMVLVSLKTGLGEWVETDFIDPFGTIYEPWSRHWSCDVIAWMPLPEPYKEGE